MKKIVSLLLAFSLIFSTFGVFAAFSDVDEATAKWAQDAIDYLANNKIIQGYEDGSFKPGANVTRAEFSKMLALSFNLNREGAGYDDTKLHWADEYIRAAGDAIYTGGASFNPDISATRADIAYAVADALGIESKTEDSVKKFTDYSLIKNDMLKKVSAAIENNIIVGYEDSTLKPENAVTRAEACVIIYRALKIKNPELDNTSIKFTGEKIGKVGDKEILSGQLDMYMQFAKLNNPSASEAEILEIAKRVIAEDEVIISLAAEYGFKIDAQFSKELKEYIELSNQQLAIEAGVSFEEYLSMLGVSLDSFTRLTEIQWLKEKIYAKFQEAFSAEDSEILEYYNSNKEEFYYDGLLAKHILFTADQTMSESEKADAKARATSVYNEIKAGGDFDALMNSYSQDPGLATNPDGYWFTKGEMVTEFEQAAYSLKVGEVSEPIESAYGYHIIKLIDKMEYLPSDEPMVKDYITQMLLQEKLNSIVEEKIKNLEVSWN